MVERAGLDPTPSLRAAIWILIKIMVAAAAVFVLVRIVAPSLMTAHNDLMFWTGVACWPAAAIIALVAGAWIYRDIRVRRGLPAPFRRMPD